MPGRDSLDARQALEHLSVFYTHRASGRRRLSHGTCTRASFTEDALAIPRLRPRAFLSRIKCLSLATVMGPASAEFAMFVNEIREVLWHWLAGDGLRTAGERVGVDCKTASATWLGEAAGVAPRRRRWAARR